MQKLIFNFFIAIITFSSCIVSAQQGGKLYLSSAGTGRVYDITGSAPDNVAASLPSAITSPTYYNTSRGAAVSNLAVGYDDSLPNRPLAFVNSDIIANAPILKNGVQTGLSNPVQIGGIGTNNVIGSNFGQVFGFSGKNLYRLYPTVSQLITVTGDALWNSTDSSVFASDTFYDYENSIYTIIENNNGGTYTRYIYKIALNAANTAGTASLVKVISGPVGARNATASSSTTTNVGNIRGLGYLNGFIFAVAGNGNNQALMYRVNISTGVSSYLATYNGTGFGTANIDLASVDYFIPFTFNCGAITVSGSEQFVQGKTSTRQINIPISDNYAPGNYVVNVSGPNFTTTSTSVAITPSTTNITVDAIYNGGGNDGWRNITVDLNASTTTCNVDVFIEKDSDGDGIVDTIDLDIDNDGILNDVECAVVEVASNPFSRNYAAGASSYNPITITAPVANLGFVLDFITLDNSFSLTVNGKPMTTKEIDFQTTLLQTIRFKDGSLYGSGSVPDIYQITGTAANPAVRVIINKNGVVQLFGSKSSGGPLFPLELFNGNVFNNILYNISAQNTFVLTQLLTGPTTVNGRSYGKNRFCDPDGDGISSEYDLDSDGDGCPDAGEGGQKFPNTSLITATGSLGTQVPNKNLGNTVDANGIPTVVSPIGQTVGDSQNAAVNSCVCYNDANSTGTAVPSKHGITLLQRAGVDNGNWPMNRSSAHTVLESNTKGFVITRMSTVEIQGQTTPSVIPAKITNPQEGMMVYDTTQKCLKLYDGANWSCFTTPTCP